MREDETEKLDAADLVEAWNAPEKLPEMLRWLKEKRSEAAQSQYAYIILKKHFARENLQVRSNEIPTRWSNFNLNFYLSIDVLVRGGNHSSMLKKLFAELVDFSEAIDEEFSAYRLLKMFENFIGQKVSYLKIAPLLPAAMFKRMDRINEIQDAEYEAYIERLNQSGY